MLDVVARARELDAFASPHDAQLAVHLRANARGLVGRLHPADARRATASCPARVPGRLVLPAAEEGAPPVLTLTFDAQAALADDPRSAAVRDVTLSLDVPQTTASGRALRGLAAGQPRAGRRHGRERRRRQRPAAHAAALRDHRRRAEASCTARSRRATWRPARRRRGACSAERGIAGDVGPRVQPCAELRQRRSAPRCARSCSHHAHRYYVLDAPEIAGRRVRPPVPGAAGDRGRASRAADAPIRRRSA